MKKKLIVRRRQQNTHLRVRRDVLLQALNHRTTKDKYLSNEEDDSIDWWFDECGVGY